MINFLKNMSDEKKSNLRSSEAMDARNLEEARKKEEIAVGKDEKESGDMERISLNEKEKAVEKVAESESSYQSVLSKIKKKSGSDDDGGVTSDAQRVSEKTDAESQIQTLVDLALNKGVTHAVRVARHLDDNYVLDKLHDSLLTDKLHKVLQEKGMI